MLRIPYVPTAYPDEILASLLTRLKLYNGSGLWRSLLEEAGYGRRTISQFFRPLMQDTKLDSLLASIGYSYPRMVQELSILPFWLCFNQATGVRFRINVKAAGGRLSKLSNLGHTLFAPGARYCPACLWEDIADHGEPYVHRTHQLPVVSVCIKHGVALRFACPACRVTVMPHDRELLRPPALRCQCGQDLSHVTGPRVTNLQAKLSLSKFAADALSSNDAPWSREQVMAVLHERSPKVRDCFKQGAVQLMREAYGPPDDPQFEMGAVLSWEGAGWPVRLRVGGSSEFLRAPEFCALLAASGLSFDEFRNVCSKIKVTRTKKISRKAHPPSIEHARREFERFAAVSPRQAGKILLGNSPRLYWLLRLCDNAWMESHGSRLRRPLPTINSDRNWINELLREDGFIKNSNPAHIRASIRDQNWLKERILARSDGRSNRQAQAQREQQERAIELSRAVFAVLRAQTRPARLHAGMLAKFVRISMHQAQHTIANTPALRAFIGSINAGKDRRLAFWATRSLVEEGRSPTTAEVLLRAGLATTRINRLFCIEAIASSGNGAVAGSGVNPA